MPTDQKPNARVSEDEIAKAAHEWFTPQFLAYECCRNCGIVRRADDKNKPCRGRVGIGLREAGPLTAGELEAERAYALGAKDTWPKYAGRLLRLIEHIDVLAVERQELVSEIARLKEQLNAAT